MGNGFAVVNFDILGRFEQFIGSSPETLIAGSIRRRCQENVAPKAQIVSRARDLNAAAKLLIDRANQGDEGDNVSVQLIRIRAVERVGMYRGRLYKLR